MQWLMLGCTKQWLRNPIGQKRFGQKKVQYPYCSRPRPVYYTVSPTTKIAHITLHPLGCMHFRVDYLQTQGGVIVHETKWWV